MTAIDNIVAPKIELAVRSINASSGRDVTSVTVNSERGEHVGINASFENASGNNNTLGVSNPNDETRHNIPDEVSELSVPETHFDRQAQTHHTFQEQTLETEQKQFFENIIISSGFALHKKELEIITTYFHKRKKTRRPAINGILFALQFCWKCFSKRWKRFFSKYLLSP